MILQSIFNDNRDILKNIWFSSVAYTLMLALRRLGLKDTQLAKAQCGTIRLKLLKIGAQIRLTVRKVWVCLSEAYPYQELFRQVYANLVRLCLVPLSTIGGLRVLPLSEN